MSIGVQGLVCGLGLFLFMECQKGGSSSYLLDVCEASECEGLGVRVLTGLTGF